MISYELIDDIGVISIDNPPVNALSYKVRGGVKAAIEAAQSDASKAILIVGKGPIFIGGADIREFGKPPIEPSLPSLLSVIENSEKIVVVAIHGVALGGGLELAMACHYRCATESARMGLPEVKLGLVPGSGGTQRLPRLVGIETALEITTSGEPISSAEAARAGLVDQIISGETRQAAINYAKELTARGAVPRRTKDIRVDSSAVSDELYASYRTRMKKRRRNQIAPQHIIDSVAAAAELSFDEGLKKERALFLECMASEQSAALRHLFFAERAAAKIEGLPKTTATREIKQIGIVGGGTMGGGIAMCFANAGFPVKLLEINTDALQKGLDGIAKNYRISSQRGKLDPVDAETRQERIVGTTSYDDLSECDLVIEAVFENLEIKKEIFESLDAVCKPGAILATNTSYLDVNLIAAATKRPEDVIGLHFFSPANVMKLLEIVRTDSCSNEVLATSLEVAKKIQKVPVVSGVCFGFIGNRMLRQYNRETQLCLLEGATPEQIDQVMHNWGMAMGPLAVADLAGLDIGYKARQALSDSERGDAKTFCIADTLAEMGRLGQKTGTGYYRYDPATRARSSDPDVLNIIQGQSKKYGITRRNLSDEEILNRLTLALVNEGFKILEEGIAQRPGDIDTVYAFGYGFPAFRGGPMYDAEQRGLTQVYQTISKYCAEHGSQYWSPSALLEKLAAEGSSLHDWNQAQLKQNIADGDGQQ